MASKSQIKTELKKALDEIGKIEPRFNKKYKAWIFSSPLYPVECEGQTSEEVIKKYPKYLEVFIEHRLKDKLDPLNEKKTKGKGGLRAGAGRPKGTKKEPTKQIRVPLDIATWIKQPGIVESIRHIIKTNTLR